MLYIVVCNMMCIHNNIPNGFNVGFFVDGVPHNVYCK